MITVCGHRWTDGNGYGHRCDRLPHDPDSLHAEGSGEVSRIDCHIGPDGEGDCMSMGRHTFGRLCVLGDQ